MGYGVVDCKKALVEAQHNLEEAEKILKKNAQVIFSKNSARVTKEGLVHAYIHGEGRLGVLVEVNCETDFVARTPFFKQFVKDIALHIAAVNPKWIQKEEVPQNCIVETQLEKFFKENCLLEQSFLKNSEQTVSQFLQQAKVTLGENIQIRRFVRFELGKEAE